MLSEIEKEYRKGLQERRFNAYYWPRAALVVFAAILGALIFNSHYWWIYGIAVVLLLAFVVIFFLKDIRVASKEYESVRASKGMVAKLQAYFAADDAMRLDNLIKDLARNQIRTKDELRLTLDYFQNRLPGNSRPNILEWVITTVITLSSIIIVTYDDEMGDINLPKLLSAFGSTVIVALVFLTPIMIFKIIAVSISKSRNKLDTILVEDLAYIYVNFDKFERQLQKA